MEITKDNYLVKLFINEAKPATLRYVGIGTADDGTYILITADGQEIPAVVVDERTVFDATANDIREGKVAVNDDGVVTGTKDIPSYHTWEGARIIPEGSRFIIPNVEYEYTKLQAIICSFNTSFDDSVSAEQVAIEDKVYGVQSVEPMSSVTKDRDNARIDFGIDNTSGKLCLIRFFMYKEIY